MALNLVRNSKVLFTTNVNATTGVIQETTASSFTASNTFEIQVLEGFSFSQNTNTEQVTINEAGSAPKRGQRSFNTSLAPVDFSFSTYIRPEFSTNVICEESVLWNALLGSTAQNTTAFTVGGTLGNVTYTANTNTLSIAGSSLTYSPATPAVGDVVLVNGLGQGTKTAAERNAMNGSGRIETVGASGITIRLDVPYTTDITAGLSTTDLKFYSSAWGQAPSLSAAGFHNSNSNQLQKFGLLIIVDNVTYAIDNCALNEVTVDFALDGIATAQWTGQASAIRQLSPNISLAGGTSGASAALSGGGTTGSNNYRSKITAADYITNKLSTVTLKTVTALGSVAAGTSYTVALTGGSVTISNNISYITPSILGIVNSPITYFSGTRSVTGSLNAYLNTGGTNDTATLLSNMLSAASSVTEPMFNLGVQIGGASNSTRVELLMPAVSLGVPSINTEQVVSTTINFTAAPSEQTGSSTTTVYNLDNRNEVLIKYFTV